jgi:stearoyl-CoA desaturase (delta-9 desaturase)
MYSLLVLPALATVVAVWHAIIAGIDPFFPALAFVLYVATGLGITVGYHRHFTHLSFETYQWVRALLGVCGQMAVQGGILVWCAKHGTHHKKSDVRGEDPHTPLEFGGGWRGFWHAHFGWLLYDQPLEKNDVWERLHDDPLVVWLDSHTLAWVVLSFLVPTVLGYMYTGTAEGALLGLLWGGGVRLFMVQHATWLVNSATHVWGTKRFGFKDENRNDESRDNWFVAFVTFGEGWHKFHHIFMKSAVHGYDRPWFDPSYLVIRTLEFMGLAWNVYVPTPKVVDRYRLPRAL